MWCCFIEASPVRVSCLCVGVSGGREEVGVTQ